MYRFYVLLGDTWDWVAEANPYIMIDVETMLQTTYGKAFIKKEYVKHD